MCYNCPYRLTVILEVLLSLYRAYIEDFLQTVTLIIFPKGNFSAPPFIVWYRGPFRQFHVLFHVVLVQTHRGQLCLGFLDFGEVARLFLLADRVLRARAAPIVRQLFPLSVGVLIVQWARTVIPLSWKSDLFGGFVAVEVGSGASTGGDVVGDGLVLAGTGAFRGHVEGEVHGLALG